MTPQTEKLILRSLRFIVMRLFGTDGDSGKIYNELMNAEFGVAAPRREDIPLKDLPKWKAGHAAKKQ